MSASGELARRQPPSPRDTEKPDRDTPRAPSRAEPRLTVRYCTGRRSRRGPAPAAGPLTGQHRPRAPDGSGVRAGHRHGMTGNGATHPPTASRQPPTRPGHRETDRKQIEQPHKKPTKQKRALPLPAPGRRAPIQNLTRRKGRDDSSLPARRPHQINDITKKRYLGPKLIENRPGGSARAVDTPWVVSGQWRSRACSPADGAARVSVTHTQTDTQAAAHSGALTPAPHPPSPRHTPHNSLVSHSQSVSSHRRP